MDGKHGIWNRIADLIKKDTTDENESMKVIVVIRVLLLSVLLYFIINMVVIWGVLDTQGRIFSILFAAGMAGLFGFSYQLRVKTAAWTFSAGLLLFIWFILVWFGWGIGVQHFLIVILMMNFFVGYEGYKVKSVMALAIMTIRIVFYYRFHLAESAYAIPPHLNDVLQVLNTISIFWCLSVICYVFSKESREVEGKLVRYNEKLRGEALTDNLTGLANRRRAFDYVEQLLAESDMASFSLCMCDIDFFKRVNDTWGHDCGDVVLKQIADIFRREMDRQNLPCRWGGEEFLLLFPNVNGDEAYEKLMRIRDAVKKMTVIYEEHEVKVTMTFGLTEFDFSKSLDDNVQEADERLYYGKNHGRDQIVF